MIAKKAILPLIHPGEILLEEFMRPLGLSQNRLAAALGINPGRLNDIVHGRSAVTANIALRLARHFGTTAEMWTSLQSDFELRTARRDHGGAIDAKVKALT